ncbi:MAG: ATP-binding cassette domain-containing protein [Clostridia bacterium]|nr:ATP-binding cassette domain-containing protein [Clostridia bacterium]
MSIVFENVLKMYNGTVVLQNVNLTLKNGVFTLRGASGAGKTTFLRLIADLEKPDAGTVCRDGAVVSYAFQEPRLFPQLTVSENILAVSPEQPDGEILAALGLSRASGKYPHELSGGMKKRAGLARALSVDADIYLLDEPTSGQDPAHAELILAAILRYTAGKLTLIATHDETFRRALHGKTIDIEGTSVVLNDND